MSIKNIPVIIDDIPNLSDVDKEQLSLLFENIGRKLLGIMEFRGIDSTDFKIYLDNGDPIPPVLQTKTVYATSADQNITADSGYDALEKVIVKGSIVLSSIAKVSGPTTTTYTAGEVFDKTGLTATATYSNSATKSLTASDLAVPTTPLTEDQTAVTVTYTEGNVTKTFDVAITVEAPEPEEPEESEEE